MKTLNTIIKTATGTMHISERVIAKRAPSKLESTVLQSTVKAPVTPAPTIAMSDQDDNIYQIGFAITAFIVFLGSWIYCIAEYGFLLGVGLGWLPSIIVAVIAGALWPLIAIVIAVIVFFAIRGLP